MLIGLRFDGVHSGAQAALVQPLPDSANPSRVFGMSRQVVFGVARMGHVNGRHQSFSCRADCDRIAQFWQVL